MAASEARIGYGTKFFIGTADAGSPPDYQEMAEVFNITAPNFEVEDVEVTHNQSPNRVREFIAGLSDPGEAGFEMNFIPGSASDQMILGLKSSGTRVPCKIEWPNATTWEFLATVKGYEPSPPTDDRMTATVTLKVSGDITTSY